MKKLLPLTVLMLVTLLAVGCDRTITGDNDASDGGSTTTPVGCFDCHDGADDLGTEVVAATRQWENSQHGSGENMRTGSCASCHTTEGYIERITDEEFDDHAYNAVGCFACHDPHDNGDFSLRTTSAVELGNGATYDRGRSNLCASCHKGRRNVGTYVYDGVEMSNHFGPHHSCQSDMLVGENAYEYDGYSYNQDSWHTTGVDEGCVTCHYEVSDGYELGGHTFWMDSEEAGENTDACNVDGCHVNAGEIDDFDRVTSNDFDEDGDNEEGVQTEINDLMHELEELLIAAGLLEWIEEDGIWEPTDELVVADGDSAGAVFNWAFVHEDQSHGIHNTRYAAALLISSINYMATGDPSGSPARPGNDDQPNRLTASLMPAH